MVASNGDAIFFRELSANSDVGSVSSDFLVSYILGLLVYFI